MTDERQRAQVSGGTGVPPVEGVTDFQRSRRNLPHWQDPGSIYFVTWRVARGRELNATARDIVLNAILHWDETRWIVHAATVMPDHVHVLAEPLEIMGGSERTWWDLGVLLHSVKSFSAYQINKQQRRKGALWLDERYDRIMRGDREFFEKWEYTRNNAVKEGLAAVAEEDPWLYERGRGEHRRHRRDAGATPRSTGATPHSFGAAARPPDSGSSLPSALILLVMLMFGVGAFAEDSAPSPAGITEPPLTAADRDHWSFRPLARPDIPSVDLAAWPRNPIDAFILEKIEAAGLEPMPAAERATLLRRVTFDLTGLPPSPEEIANFVADDAPDAYERVVDRLLESPAYGERAAQHWLDLVRFAETDGFEHDKVRPEAWRYRDWVIGAFNGDLPFDEFVKQQLAADELRPDDENARHALGFYLCGTDMPDINRQEERRHVFLNDMTGTVGSVFLALQAGCAQCHDHKWDPVSQADFYRLRAFFDPLLEFKKNQPPKFVAKEQTAPASFLMIRGEFHRPGPKLSPAYPRIANISDASVDETLAKSAAGRRTALTEWLTQPDRPLMTRVIVNRLWQQHFGEGLSRTPSDFGIMGDEPEHLALLDWLAAELPRRGWSLKAMHRLMVTSATYRQASRPTGSEWDEATLNVARDRWQNSRDADPDNRLLARMSRRRLEGEAIRDATLAAADRLQRQHGGPGVRPPLPEELVKTLLKNQWPVTEEADQHDRRSIYLFVRRNLRFPLFEAFDRPDGNASCARRNQSTIAPQALVLLNSADSLDAAKSLAAVLLREGHTPDERIRLACLRTLGREPTDAERTQLTTFLTAQAEQLRRENRPRNALAVPADLPAGIDPFEAAALTDLCLVMFNRSEFLYVD